MVTRAEWDALSAREKGAVVAEKVMGLPAVELIRAENVERGWPAIWGWTADHARLGVAEIDDDYFSDAVVLMSLDDDEGVDVWYPPAYASSWDRMEEVATRLRELDYGVGLYGGTGGYGWEVELRPRGEDDGSAVGLAPTAPEALCIAALIALGWMETLWPREGE